MNWEERAARLRAISKILEGRKVRSQEELLPYLKGEGFRITQATLSRDLKNLGVSKRPDRNGGYVYSLGPGNSGRDVTGELQAILRGFLWMAFSGNHGLIRTLPGFASSVASGLDSLALREILGTIAGDDTILVVPGDGVSRDELAKALVTRIPALKERVR
jgi:transcriptional regulator of arginine metabolism